MTKSVGLIVLILAAIAVGPQKTVAERITADEARSQCKGWTHNYKEHFHFCASCKQKGRKVKCDWYFCETGKDCDHVVVETTRRGEWKVHEPQTKPVEKPTQKKP